MVTTHALKCIEKKGGLDQYLVSSKHVDDSYVGKVLRSNLLVALRENPEIPFPVPNERMPSVPKAWRRVSTL
jgi:hypothetical protein